MLEQVIKNEIVDCLGRNPDDNELRGFMDYVHDYLLEQEKQGKLGKTYLADIGLVIYEYRNDNYKQCCDCGEYYLADSDEWNDDGEHCLNCKPHQDYDTMADYLHDESVCDEVMGY